MLTFGSLFAGIRGIDEGLRRCGLAQLYAAELDPKCNRVGQKHFPGERTYEDVATVCGPGLRPDVLTAGWPCQGNSVAGRRGGMADERSGLWGEVARILAEQRPRWFLGENVPGLLSVCGCRLCSAIGVLRSRHTVQRGGRQCRCAKCNDGRRIQAAHKGSDFFSVLADLAKLGYGFAYRILDSQWFGVAQRRRRVFIVGHLGDWRRAAEVLFERESLPWDPAPSRKAGSRVAQTITRGTDSSGRGGYAGRRQEDDYNLVARTLTASVQYREGQSETFVTHTLTGERPYGSEDGTGRGIPIVAFDTRHHVQAVQKGKQGVRRLTPTERCRLQGFPDDWLDGLGLSDSAKYRMLGNSVTVSVLEWIGTRLLRNHEDAAHT